MKFSAHTRTKRNTAFVVVLVWLFALVSGVVNACLLETHEPHARVAMTPAATLGHAHAELPAETGSDTDHYHHSDGTKESCLKVCSDGTHTLLKASSGVDHNDPGPAPLVATLWTASQQVASAPRRADDWAIPMAGPPLRVRYTRLAL